MSGPGSAARAETAPKKDLGSAIKELERRKLDDILTAEEVATLTGSSVQTVYNWCNRSERPLRHEKPGREYRIRVEDLIEFLRARTFRPRDVKQEEGGEAGGRAEAERQSSHLARTHAPRPRHDAPEEVRTSTPGGDVPLALAEGRPIRIEVEPERADLLDAIRDPADARRVVRAAFELALETLRWRRAALTLKAASGAADIGWAGDARRAMEGQEARLLARSSGIEPQVVEMLLLALQESGEPRGGAENTRAYITLVDTAAAGGNQGEPWAANAKPVGDEDAQRLAALDVTTETLRRTFEAWAVSAASDGVEAEPRGEG